MTEFAPLSLKELAEQMDELKKHAQESGQYLFKQALSEYFEMHPIAQEIYFDGYAPYFNDGEPCEFHVNDYSLKVNGCGEEDSDSDVDRLSETLWTGWNHSTNSANPELPNPDYDPELDQAYQDMLKIIRMVPEETYQDMFGSSFSVIVRRDGTMEIDEAPEHD